MMKPKLVNPLRWAAYGAFFGLALTLVRSEFVPWEVGVGVSYNVSSLIGGLIGGAFLFGIAAWVRNLFTPKLATATVLKSDLPQVENLTGAPQRSNTFINYIKRHWRGELSLAISYWVNLFLLNIPIAVAMKLFGDWDLYRSEFKLWGTLALVLFSVVTVITIWQVFGVWRSAGNHIATTKRRFWAVVARFMVVLGGLQYMVIIGQYGPAYIETVKIVTGQDQYGDFNVSIDPSGRVITVNGDLGYGLTEKVQTMVQRYPKVSTLVLNSRGGRPFEARLLRDLIETGSIKTTRSDKGCYSACIIPFLAGVERHINIKANLGFHRYSFPGEASSAEIEREADAEIEIDKIYMREKGVPYDFIKRVFSTPNEKVWRPGGGLLFDAGFITGVIDDDNLLSRTDYHDLVRKEVERDLNSLPVYKAIKKAEPGVYAELKKRAIAGLWRGDSSTEIAGKFKPFLTHLMNKYLPYASSEAVRKFMFFNRDTLDALKKSPKACRAFFYPKKGETIKFRDVMPKNLQDRSLALIALVIETGAQRMGAPVSEQEGSKLFEPIGLALYEKFGDQIEMFDDPHGPAANAEVICQMETFIYHGLVAMDPVTSEKMMRHLMASK